ncbi:MAG: hypothetical protein L6R36_007941 [Xanthoria steineri]|nr:MAG: hypothetical protein L6R36_007941 [Xanthoria steineri]
MGQGMHPSHDGERRQPIIVEEDRSQDYSEGPNGQGKPSPYAKAARPYPSNPPYASKYEPGDGRPASNHDNASYPGQDANVGGPLEPILATSIVAAVPGQDTNSMHLPPNAHRVKEAKEKRDQERREQDRAKAEEELSLKEQEPFNMSIPKTRTPMWTLQSPCSSTAGADQTVEGISTYCHQAQTAASFPFSQMRSWGLPGPLTWFAVNGQTKMPRDSSHH